MVRTRETEKSGSKSKKAKTGSKEETTKAIKAPKAKASSDAKNPEASISRGGLKKELKKPAATTPKTLDTVKLDGSSSSGQKVKKSKTKTDGESSSKDRGATAHISISSPKKRAREEPTTDSSLAASFIKRKKLDQKTEVTGEKQPVRKKRVANPPSTASEESEADSLEKKGRVGEEDEDVYLHGFSTDEDSSDEGEEIMDQDPLEVKNLSSKAKEDADVKRRLDAAKKKLVCILLAILSLLTFSLRPRIEVCYTLAEYLMDSTRSR
jgi:nucleolar protein 15